MKIMLLVTLMGLVACEDKDSPVMPVPPPPVAKTHTLEFSYWLESYGDASQLPATAPVITVVLRPVRPGAAGRPVYQWVEPLLNLRDVSTTVKKVRLPDVTTYDTGPPPLLIGTVAVPAVPATGPGMGYYVQGHYTVDGVLDLRRAVFYDAVVASDFDLDAYTIHYELRH